MDEVLLAGLDVGTTKAKGALFDPSGTPVAQAERGYPLHRPRPGWAEQDPEDWWAAVVAILGELGAAAGAAGRPVAALGVVSQVNTHVFADASGRALSPAITWQDGRCAAVAAELDARLSAADRQALWGGPFTVDASYLPSRVAWMARERPELLEATRWVLSPKDHVIQRLTGEVASDPISSVGLAGADGSYLVGLDRVVPGVTALLPPLRGAAERAGTVRPGPAPGFDGCPVAVGTMDAWGNLHGSGIRVGEGMHVAGTSEVIAILAGPEAPGAPGVIRFPPQADGATLLAAPTQAGGDALRWYAAAHGLGVHDVLAEAAGVEPGAGGLVFLPHLAGERAPLWDADLRGAFLGLGLEHTRAHLGRAVLEGVGLSARHLLEAVAAAAGGRPAALRLSGGGAASDLWCQIKADAMGIALERLRVRDTGVLGAALLGGVAAGLLEDVGAGAHAFVSVERVFTPGAAAARMDALYAVYREAQAALTDAQHALAAARAG